MTPYDTGRSTDVDPSSVQTHADFVAVCEAMFDDYEKSVKDEWENHTLGRFLDGLAALAEALPQSYANGGEVMPEPPTWRLFAELLTGTTGYE
jgi:hypothetical protein